MPLQLPPIPPFDGAAVRAAKHHQSVLTKPPGSLGRLESLATWYAGARGQFPVAVPERAELFVFAADHGVTVEGISPYPAAVTAAMVANFRAGGAAVNALARQSRVSVSVVDVGVFAATDRQDGPGGSSATPEPPADETATPGSIRFLEARIRSGTRNLRREPAMTTAEAEAAFAVGMRLAGDAAARGCEVLLGGDMGIGNTTAAAALVCAFGGGEPSEVVGRGTGADDLLLAQKIAVVKDALALHRPAPSDPWAVLSSLGGLEIAALAGLMVGGAAARVPTIVDGFIAGAAALFAVRLCPAVRDYLLLSHLSAERGARGLCALLGDPPPLLQLELRLGEGTGAVLVVPLLRAAVAAQAEMATFTGAGVPDRPDRNGTD